MAKAWKLQARQSGKDGLWYVNLAGGNGETIMRSKGFKDQVLAVQLCKEVQGNEIAVLTDPSSAATGQRAFQVQPHLSPKDNLWYVRLTAPKGDLMWSEGYVRKDSAQRTCTRLKDAMVLTLEPLPHPRAKAVFQP